jgi:hypothetical protein
MFAAQCQLTSPMPGPEVVRGRNWLIETPHRLRYDWPRGEHPGVVGPAQRGGIIASAASAAAYSRVAEAGCAQSLSPPLCEQSVPSVSPDGMYPRAP